MWVIYFQIFGAPLDVYCWFFFYLILLGSENILGKIFIFWYLFYCLACGLFRWLFLQSSSMIVTFSGSLISPAFHLSILNFSFQLYLYLQFVISFLFVDLYIIWSVPFCLWQHSLCWSLFHLIVYCCFSLIMLISSQFFNLNLCCRNVFHLIMNNHFSLIMLNFLLILSLKFVFLHLL